MSQQQDKAGTLAVEEFQIERIDPLPLEGFTRGHVVITIADDSFGDDPPVTNAVDIGCFIPHDATATLEEIEAEFLRHARRLLSEAAALLDLPTATDMRKRGADVQAARRSRLQATLDAGLDEAFEKP